MAVAVLASLLLLASSVAYVWQPRDGVDYAPEYLRRVRSEFVDTPVARMHYVKTGDGPPVILVPGGGQWSYSYRDTIPALAEHFTVFAVDLPGQGFTELRTMNFEYDLGAMADALSGFMDAVGLEKATIVGHSWGGAEALYLAEVQPHRIEKLVLIASPALDVESSPDWRPLEYPIVGELIGKLMRKEDAARMLRKAFNHPDRVTDEMVRENWAAMSRRENRRAMWELQRNLDYRQTERRLPDVTAPTLVLWGADDRFDAPWQARELGRRIPDAEVHVLDDCGHNVHEDCPEASNRILVRFLSAAGAE